MFFSIQPMLRNSLSLKENINNVSSEQQETKEKIAAFYFKEIYGI